MVSFKERGGGLKIWQTIAAYRKLLRYTVRVFTINRESWNWRISMLPLYTIAQNATKEASGNVTSFGMWQGCLEFTWGPKSQFTWGQYVQSQLLRAWKNWDLPLRTGPSPKSPSTTWVPTWQNILEVRLATCVESYWVKQKARPNSQPKPQDFSHKIMKIP